MATNYRCCWVKTCWAKTLRPPSLYHRTLHWLLVVACGLCCTLPVRRADDASDESGRSANLLADDGGDAVAVLNKDASAFARLTRRTFLGTPWESLDCTCVGNLAVQSDARHPWTSSQILSEFARREVAGVLLS